MKTKLLFRILTIITALGLGVRPSLADSGHGYSHSYLPGHECCAEMMGPHAHAADHLHHLLKHQKEIGLAEEQVKKLKAIDLDYDRARIKAEAEIRVAERELLALVEEEKTELSAIEAKVNQSEMLEVGLRMSAYKARRDALAVLTPEQREKAKAAHEKRMQEMMHGRQGTPPSGGH
ncbi:MAG TPA: periplasmic heavy metal sensor [Nitrospira sp.]|nr:periplasmic heavy metal sensor [Nitrospira sp.]